MALVHDDPLEDGVAVVSNANTQVALLNESEINQQIATAKKYPRSIRAFRDQTLQLVTLSPEIAEECVYALPRAGKTLVGASIRFAEIAQSAWGNCRSGGRIVHEEQGFITAQGVFHDLQSNSAITIEVRRRITDSKGKRFNDDMIGVTGAAATSIALRNAILRGVPKAIWFDMFIAAQKVVAGDFKTLPTRRAAAFEAAVIYGVTKSQILASFGIKGEEDFTLDHMVQLKGILNALKEGTIDVATVFPPDGVTVPDKRPNREDYPDDEKKKGGKKAASASDTAIGKAAAEKRAADATAAGADPVTGELKKDDPAVEDARTPEEKEADAARASKRADLETHLKDSIAALKTADSPDEVAAMHAALTADLKGHDDLAGSWNTARIERLAMLDKATKGKGAKK